MAGQYKVYVKGVPGEVYGPYSLASAKDFARIGSQTGACRIVKRGRKKVREYRRGKRVWPVTSSQVRGLSAAEVPRELRGGSKKRNPSRKARYIYPKEKAFPVGDAEHERRAMAYVRAGRASVRQVVEVPAWLAKHSKDPDVHGQAQAAVKAWKAKGQGDILQGFRAISSRQGKRSESLPASINVELSVKHGALLARPWGANNFSDVQRALILRAVRRSRGAQRAKAVEALLKAKWLGSVRGEKAIYQAISVSRLKDKQAEALFAGRTVKAEVPSKVFLGWV